MHEGVKFKCPFCEHKAAHKSNLKNHIKVIHEKITFQCPYCEHKSHHKRTLRNHVQTIHKALRDKLSSLWSSDTMLNYEIMHLKPCDESSLRDDLKENVGS